MNKNCVSYIWLTLNISNTCDLVILTFMENQVTAASLAKYILYNTRHSFWVCNLMLAIKNSCAASQSTQFYWFNAFKSNFPSSCDRLVSPRGICYSKPQSAIPTLFSRPITQFISNCWLITKNYGLWERPQNGSLMFLWFSSIELLLVCFFPLLFLAGCAVELSVNVKRVEVGSDVREVKFGSIVYLSRSIKV